MVASFRLSRLAEIDLAHILATSTERWGPAGRQRYAELLTAAMRALADDRAGSMTQNRASLARGIRSFHLRHVRVDEPEERVRRLVHVIYFRAVTPGLIEIVRVLHERMEPSRHLSPRSQV